MDEAFIRSILNEISGLVVVLDENARIVQFNRTAEEVTGYRIDLAKGRSFCELFLDAEGRELIEKEISATDPTSSSGSIETDVFTRAGVRRRIVWSVGRPVHRQDLWWIVLSGVDVTDTRRIEQELQTLASVVHFSSELINIATLNGRMIFLNDAGCRMLGIDADEVQRRMIHEVFSGQDLPMVENNVLPTIRSGQTWKGELTYRNLKTGALTQVLATTFPIPDKKSGLPYCLANVSLDITDRKSAEAEKVRLEGQFHQSQKLEAIGRLAGGIAHDFNNLLTAIVGSAEMVMLKLKPEDHVREDVDVIKIAGERASALTQQLLAFGRKQIIAPVPLELNRVISDSTKMLRRLICEDIDFAFLPGHDLGWIRADPHQIDQILVNLAVNARDAMPGGGKLTIETTEACLDEPHCHAWPDVTPGRHVVLVVRDDGCGMAPEVQAQIFEPFFTTKEIGKGTGLGLATVYGIVKQNQGEIEVQSDVGIGTTFKVYFPRIDPPGNAQEPTATPVNLTGNETILLVEDDPIVRSISCRILSQNGYRVLPADDGRMALRLIGNNKGPIDLLLTDVVMPMMNGRALYDQIRRSHPETKILFMSGYTGNVIAHHGVLEEGADFLEKPFTIESLTRKVREVLDKPHGN